MDGNPESNRIRVNALISIKCIVIFWFVAAHGRTEGDELRNLQDVPENAQPLSVNYGSGALQFAIETASNSAPGPRANAAKIIRPAPRLVTELAQTRASTRTTSGDLAPNQPSVGSGSRDVIAKDAVSTSSNESRLSRLDRPRITVEEALRTPGSITFRKTPLSEVVFLMSDLWHINIVAGDNVTGEVSGTFHKAPLSEVLSAALSASGYGYRKLGNSLVVLPIEEIGADAPDIVSRLIRLPESAQGDDTVLQAAELLLSERGQVRPLGEVSLLVVDTPERIERIAELVLDLAPRKSGVTNAATEPASASAAPGDGAASKLGIAYFTPQFTEAEEMAEPLQMALGDRVIVAVYPNENRLLVKGTEADLRLAADAIQQLDRPREQVRITAMIYDVGISELEKLGINWTRDLRAVANDSSDAFASVSQSVRELFAFTSDMTTTGATSIGLRTLTDTISAGVFLELLDSTSEAKLLADPSITVGDRQQASIRIVRRIPIVGANPIENSNAVFTQTEFEEAGVILNVRPRISRDGTIELQVQPEYSVVAELTATGPVIDSRRADTTVRVGNGQMFVLGGLRQKSVVESVRGIPGLKDMKHFGKFFRSHDTEIRESELIVFLKPELVSPYCEGSLRKQQAACVTNQLLDEIPHAETGPMIPCCRDPHCPNHHPRPRINGGTTSLEMLGGCGLNCYQRQTDAVQPGTTWQNERHLPPGSTIVPGSKVETLVSPESSSDLLDPRAAPANRTEFEDSGQPNLNLSGARGASPKQVVESLPGRQPPVHIAPSFRFPAQHQ